MLKAAKTMDGRCDDGIDRARKSPTSARLTVEKKAQNYTARQGRAVAISEYCSRCGGSRLEKTTSLDPKLSGRSG